MVLKVNDKIKPICQTPMYLQCYPVCPYCYNYSPFKDMRKGMACNECTHPTCVYSVAMNGVSSCMECENGVLNLDQTSGPKWKLACNK